MSKYLKDIEVGGKCRVVGITKETTIRQFLFQMGVLPGTIIEIVRNAPLEDPIEIRVRDYNLAIRRADAGAITVEEVNES